MSIFVVISPIPSNPKLEAAIKEKYPKDHYVLHSNQWLVSAKGTTSQAISNNLGISAAAQNDNASKTGPAIVFAVSNYWGNANTAIWEWISANWGKSGD